MGRKGTMRAGDKVWAASSTLRKLKGKLLADAGQSVEGELLGHAKLAGKDLSNVWRVNFAAAPDQVFDLKKQCLRRKRPDRL